MRVSSHLMACFILVLICMFQSALAIDTDPAGSGDPHPNVQPSLALNYIVQTEGNFNDLGRISLFAGNFAPGGWEFANGQILPILDNQALFAVLGTTYGGNGTQNFALPDLRGRTAIHEGTGVGLTSRPLGGSFGSETETLTTAHLPVHEHPIASSPPTGPAGGGQPHLNLQPSLTVNHIINANGIFPSRDVQTNSPFLGEVSTTARSVRPDGYEFTDGQSISIVDNQALFALLGISFGGNGTTAFELPDIRGRTAIHEGSGNGLTTRFLGESLGVEEVTLTEAELPTHSHGIPNGSTETVGNNQSHLNMQPSLGMNYIIATEGFFPSRDGLNDQTFIGQVSMFAGNFAPGGWAFTDGQSLPIVGNEALFSLLGTTYGGDGVQTFQLPDLRGRTPIHSGIGNGLTNRTLRDSIGTENVGLTTNTMPMHVHKIPEPTGLLNWLFALPLLVTRKRDR